MPSNAPGTRPLKSGSPPGLGIPTKPQDGREEKEEEEEEEEEDEEEEEEEEDEETAADNERKSNAEIPAITDLNDLEDNENFIIDKNEMVETSDDQDLLSSPSSKMSLESDGEQEIDGFTNFNMILEYPKLNFEYKLLGSFDEEIMDWFSAKDLQNMRDLKLVALSSKYYDDIPLFLEQTGSSLKSLLMENDNSSSHEVQVLKHIVGITYICLGSYGDIMNKEQLNLRLRDNAQSFVHQRVLMEQIVHIMLSRANKLADAGNCEYNISSKSLKLWSSEMFYTLTILHILSLVYLKYLKENEAEYSRLVNLFDDTNLLEDVTKVIDKWRWISCESERKDPASIINFFSKGNAPENKENIHNSTGKNQETNTPDSSAKSQKSLNTVMSFRLRNIVIFLDDLLLLEFGDLDHLESTKEFVEFRNDKNQAHKKLNSDCSLTISPIDYRKYRESLITRYPTFTPPQYDVSEIVKLSLRNEKDVPTATLPNIVTSISMLSSEGKARSIEDESISGDSKLDSSPPPEIHIATPMPSPSLTPQSTGGSDYPSIIDDPDADVRRRLNPSQSNYPNIYPLSRKVPYSIEEASNILYQHVKDDFNSKQFVSVFEQFVRDEKGIKTESDYKLSSNESDIFKYTEQDIKNNPMFVQELRSLQRVEKYYRNCLSYLSSLIYVLIQIISSNVITLHGNERPFRQRGQHSHGNYPYMNATQEITDEEDKIPYLPSQLTSSEKQKLEVIRMKESTLKSASNIITLLSKWLKASHILKYEYFLSLLFDSNFISQTFRLLNSNKIHSRWSHSYDFKDPESLIKNRLIYCDYEVLYQLKDYNFYLKALSLSSKAIEHDVSKMDEKFIYEHIFDLSEPNADKNALSFILPFNAQCNLTVQRPNNRYCVIATNLFEELYMMISHFKIQRIYKLLETRPTDTLRFYLTLFNQTLYRPILKIIKIMSPFSGKKWRANNMDMISFVYLFYKIGLHDRWLTNYFTSTLEERLRVSYESELSLRCLLKYYNVKNYSDILKKFGYDIQGDKFLKSVKKGDENFFEAQLTDGDLNDEFHDYLKLE